MWDEYMRNNYFLKKLYNKIPPLENIIIRDIIIERIWGSENDLKIEFEMPNFVDNIPEKWKRLNYNGIYIRLDFYNTMDISMETKQNFNYSSIKINKIDDIYQVELNGKLCLHFKTKRTGYIQYIKGIKK
ncbi:Imm50 family immunity protein [uncultured Megamonas sp.]|uniref:Imm50 family immunity protein n=1 Tax=uncultured Megamonas sp. TaxID=286140 RepID=UPI00259B5AC9|nr:Imm50 family immunity protein [uncultured Megamonas sp.]